MTVDATGSCNFRLPLTRTPLLELTYALQRSSPERVLFYVTGGWLARVGSGRARLEFREVLERREVLAMVHDFEPRLPWYVYSCTQARVHRAVRHAFGRHLRRVAITRR